MTKRGAFRYAGMITQRSLHEHQVIPDNHPGIFETDNCPGKPCTATDFSDILQDRSVSPASL